MTGRGKEFAMVQSGLDHEAIIATAMDYFEGWFNGDAERIARALHPDLNKRGVGVDGTGALLSDQSTATQMIGWTRAGEGKAERPADLAIKVRVDDVYEQIATATVYSAVYIEYLQLIRTRAGWRIVNALFMRRGA
jgi:Putative lumazine-binding